MADAVEMTFVTQDVMGGTWLEWGNSIENITDMVDQAIAKLRPGQCIGRLIIVGHGNEKSDGFLVFDAETTGGEIIDGGFHRNPVMSPTITTQAARLRPYLCPEAVIEFRICRLGKGDNGVTACQALADLFDRPVTAPTESIKSIAGLGGIATYWRTAYPSTWLTPQTVSFWRTKPTPPPGRGRPEDIAPVTAQYVPLRGVDPPTSLTPPNPPPVTAVPMPGGSRPTGGAIGVAAVATGAALAVGLGLGLSGGGSPTAAPPTTSTSTVTTVPSSGGTTTCPSGSHASSLSIGGESIPCTHTGSYACTPSNPAYFYVDQEFEWKNADWQIAVTLPHFDGATSSSVGTGDALHSVQLYQGATKKDYRASSGSVSADSAGTVTLHDVSVSAGDAGAVTVSGEMTCN